MRGMFGQLLDDGLGQASSDRWTANCQEAVAKAAQKCQDAMLGEFNRCKKDALRGKTGAPVTTAEELQEACLGSDVSGMPDPKGKIAKACAPGSGWIARALSKSCAARGADVARAFRGSTEILGEGASDAAFDQHLAALAKCEVWWARSTGCRRSAASSTSGSKAFGPLRDR